MQIGCQEKKVGSDSWRQNPQPFFDPCADIAVLRKQVADHCNRVRARPQNGPRIGARDPADRDQWPFGEGPETAQFFEADHRIGILFRCRAENGPEGQIIGRLPQRFAKLKLVVRGIADQHVRTDNAPRIGWSQILLA